MAIGHGGPGGRARKTWRALAMAFAFLGVAVRPVHAQSPVANLQQVEAAYILKFATYVQWPARAFRTPADPLVLGVMNDMDLARALVRLARGRQIGGRPVHVRFMGVDDKPHGLHILVLPRAGNPARRRILRDLAAQPVLTIAPPDQGAASDRAMVQLVLEADRLRFDVAMPSRNVGLQISALMLTAARRVDNRMLE